MKQNVHLRVCVHTHTENLLASYSFAQGMLRRECGLFTQWHATSYFPFASKNPLQVASYFTEMEIQKRKGLYNIVSMILVLSQSL